MVIAALWSCRLVLKAAFMPCILKALACLGPYYLPGAACDCQAAKWVYSEAATLMQVILDKNRCLHMWSRSASITKRLLPLNFPLEGGDRSICPLLTLPFCLSNQTLLLLAPFPFCSRPTP